LNYQCGAGLYAAGDVVGILMSDHQRPESASPTREPFPVSRFFGLSLSEAFRRFVLEDPEISALGKMIVEQEHSHGEVFNEGQYPGPWVEFKWPLDITASDLVFQFVRPVVFVFPGPPLPDGSEVIHRVSTALADRLQSLRRMLVEGQIVAHGTFVNSGLFGPINRLQWARSGLSIDVKSGDLLQDIDHRAVAQWSGLALEAPAGSEPSPHRASSTGYAAEFHVNSTKRDGQPSGLNSTSKGTSSAGKITPHHASIEAAIAAIWPTGIPTALPLKTRDEKIIDWQKKHALAVASSKTIRRYLAAKAKST
jgi:hypothetical protein